MLTNILSNRLGPSILQSDISNGSPLAKLHSSAKLNQLNTNVSAVPSAASAPQITSNSSRWFDSARLIANAEADPLFAKETAKNYAYTPDKMTLNWADAPSPANKEAWDAWVNQTVEFDKEAAPINVKRIELYNSLKAQGTSDVDVLKAMVNFNGSQPAQYQIKTGFWKLDATA